MGDSIRGAAVVGWPGTDWRGCGGLPVPGQQQLEPLDLEGGSRDQALGTLPCPPLGQDHDVRGGEIRRQGLAVGGHIFTNHNAAKGLSSQLR